MFTLMTRNITVRSVNPALWRELKAEAAREGMNTGDAINHAIEKWLNEMKRKGGKARKSFWDVRPIKLGGKAERLSEEVDETIYGWKR